MTERQTEREWKQGIKRECKKCLGEKKKRKRQRRIPPLLLRVIIAIAQFSMKRQQVEPNGKYADVCKYVGWVAQRPTGRLKLFGMERAVEKTSTMSSVQQH